MTKFIKIEKKPMDSATIQRNLDAANAEFREQQLGFTAEILSLETMKVAIKIEWGDWKHVHGFADYTMKVNGFSKVDEVVTEDDGDDCYSSIHYYMPC